MDPARLRAAAPDLLISAGHRYLIAPAEIAVPRLGTVGLHPALLPRYRGSHPLWWALHNHESEAGITLYRLDAGIDTGPIIAQRVVPIVPGDTFRSLYLRTVKEIPSILAELQAAIARTGELPAGTVQDEAPGDLLRAAVGAPAPRQPPRADRPPRRPVDPVDRVGRPRGPGPTVTVESSERPSVTDPARPAPRVGMVAYFFPPVGGVAVARTMGSVRYLPDAGWTPVVIAPAGSTYHLTDAAGLDSLPAGLEVERARTFEPGHLRRVIVALRGRASAPATRGDRSGIDTDAVPRRRHPPTAPTPAAAPPTPHPTERRAHLARPDPPDAVVPGRPAGLDPVRGDGRPACACPRPAGRAPLELVAGQRARRRGDRVAAARASRGSPTSAIRGSRTRWTPRWAASTPGGAGRWRRGSSGRPIG